jgi:hypothetical protein
MAFNFGLRDFWDILYCSDSETYVVTMAYNK